jgi:murein DD-endopeptidase MepM/ murein hydrolase activator NlpD
MTRARRPGGSVLLAGLGGFVLGAATVLFVLWSFSVGRQDRAAANWQPAPAPPPSQAMPEGPAPGLQVPAQPNAGAPAPGAPSVPPASARPAPAPAPTQPAPANPRPAPWWVEGLAVPGAPSQAPPAPTGSPDIDALRQRRLLLPVQGVRPEQLNDTFADSRGNHAHEALDIMAQRSTPVLAVEDGRVAKLFYSRYGGNTIYQFDPSATYSYYYAHLDRYAEGLREGDALRRGQVIAYVGTTGNAPPDAPHLHFSIFRLNPDKHWWQGTAINPYPVFHFP